MDERPVMDDAQLATYLQEMERQAVSYRDSDLAEEQAAAIDFYEARAFGDEEEGRSQVVVPVVQEVCDYMGVSVLRTFISGDRVVEFEPSDEEDEDGAEEATEAVNYTFMREQDGYKVLHDWLKTGLIEKIGVVKTGCVEEENRKRRTVTFTVDELAAFMEEKPDGLRDMEPIEHTENEDGTHTVKLQQVTRRKRYIDLPIPNYEFLFSPRTRHEDESEYLAHRCRKSVSDLIEMGFDRDKVEGLSAYDDTQNSDGREQATWGDEYSNATNDNIPGLRKVTLREEYARIDWDGDGKAELLKVFRVGNVILEVEETDEQPFIVFCPFPRPHRLVGNGLADKVMDIQRNKSVIMRQSFDAMYLSNDPKLWLPDESTTDDTIDDLLTKGPGVIVRGRGARPEALVTPFDVGKTVTMFELLSGEQESRTGITRLNQGLDAEAMNKTATGMAMQSSAGQQIEEFVARNFAEALSRLFMKKVRLMIEHGDPIAMRVGGEFKKAVPGEWSGEFTASIRVGLGSGKKEARIQSRLMVAQLQADAMQSGTGLVDPKRLYHTGAGIVRDSGLGNPNDFFIDPDSEDYKPDDKPDPEKAKLDAEMAMQEAKLKGEQQLASIKLDGLRAESEAKQTLARQQAEFEAQLAERKFQAEMEMAERKAQAEMVLADRRMEMEERMGQHKATLAQSANDAKISQNRPGGDLSK